MRKMYSFLAVGMALTTTLSAYADRESYDFEGSFYCIEARNIVMNNQIELDELEPAEWTGKKVQFAVNDPWGDTPNEIKVTNLLPMAGYFVQYFYSEIDPETGILSFITDRCKYKGYTLYGYEDGEYVDLKGVFSEDLSTVTFENLRLYNGTEVALSADKLVYEVARIPLYPDIYASFDPAAGGINVTVTAPLTYNYECGFAPIQGTIDKIVLSRSDDWGDTYTEVATWTDINPGQELNYVDSDFVIEQWYTYKAEVFIGVASADDTAGCSAGSPAPSVQGLSAVASEGNMPPVTVTFTLPDAEELSIPLDEVTLYRRTGNGWDDGDIIATYTEGLDAGKTITYVDETAEPGNMITYTVKTRWAYGSDYGQSAALFIGEDGPGSVVNLTAQAEGKKVTLSWEATDNGRNGGHCDPSTIKFMVKRRVANDTYDWDFGGYPTEVTVTPEEGITETTLTDELDADAPFEYSYIVYTFAEGYEPYNGGSVNIIAGPNYSLPFVESFDVYASAYSRQAEKIWNWKNTFDGWGYLQARTTYSSSYDDSRYSTCYAVGDTNTDSYYGEDHPLGFLTAEYYSYYDANDCGYYTSYPIDFSNAKNPVASFYYFTYYMESTGTLGLAAGNAADEPTAFKTYFTANPTNDNLDWDGEWVKAYVSLSELEGNEAARVAFYFNVGETPTGGTPLCIDNLVIDNYPGVEEISAPVEGQVIKLQWVDPSTETQKVSSYEVYMDGKLAATTTETSAEFTETGDHTFYVIAYYDGRAIVAPMSPEVSVSNVGIGAVVANGKVMVEGRNIVTDSAAAIYTADGRKVYAGTEGGSFNAEKGVYLVVMGGKTVKVIVK